MKKVRQKAVERFEEGVFVRVSKKGGPRPTERDTPSRENARGGLKGESTTNGGGKRNEPKAVGNVQFRVVWWGSIAMGKGIFKLRQRKRGRLWYERERERELKRRSEPCLDGRLVGQEGGGTIGKVGGGEKRSRTQRVEEGGMTCRRVAGEESGMQRKVKGKAV